MLIDLQIGTLYRGGGQTPPPAPTLPDSEKPDLFRVKELELLQIPLKTENH